MRPLFVNGNTAIKMSELDPDATMEVRRRMQKDPHFFFPYEMENEDYLTTATYSMWLEDIANRCLSASMQKSHFPRVEIEEAIDDFETVSGMKLSDEQREGVVTLLLQRFSILTGGPGTGKTSVIKCVMHCIKKLDPDSFNDAYTPIKLLAPTGKAARRMSESTGKTAYTILGAIGYTPYGDRITNTIPHRYIIVDEFSMVDLPTFARLCAATTNDHTHIIVIGDINQLPSVGEGALLRDMIASNIFTTYQLTKTFRQKDGSVLMQNIGIIKDGGNEPLIAGDDFELHETLDDFIDIYTKNLQAVGLENIAVLTPTRRVGKYCSNKLNAMLQEKVNPSTEFVETTVFRDGEKNKIRFKVGDPVIQLKNREIANGEVGTVVKVTSSGHVTVRYIHGQQVYYLDYKPRELDQLDLAYAISIHKSQGSEYKTVLVLCTAEGNLDKNMLYTAVTRAKDKCIVFGTKARIASACKIDNTWSRITAFPYIMKMFYINFLCKKDLEKANLYHF